MLRKLKSYSKVILVSGGNVFNAMLGFLFLSATAKFLDLDSFGRYALLTSILLIISKLMDFGMNSVFVAKSIIGGEESTRNRFIALKIISFGITIPLSLIFLALLGILTPITGIVMIGGLIAYLINYTLYPLFQKEEKYLEIVLLNTVPGIAKGIFALLIFTNYLEITYEGAFAIFSLTMLLSGILFFRLSKEDLEIKPDFKNIRVLFVEALPAGISQLINEGWPALNNTLAKISNTFSDVGIFTLASKISNIFTLLALSIFTVLLPKNAKRKSEKRKYDFIETFVISIGVMIMASSAIVLAQLFITRVFGDKFEGSLLILDILIFSSALSAIQMFLENYFFVEKKTKTIMNINLSKIALFGVFAIFLIPLYSLYGLAISNLIASSMGLIITITSIKRTEA